MFDNKIVAAVAQLRRLQESHIRQSHWHDEHDRELEQISQELSQLQKFVFSHLAPANTSHINSPMSIRLLRCVVEGVELSEKAYNEVLWSVTPLMVEKFSQKHFELVVPSLCRWLGTGDPSQQIHAFTVLHEGFCKFSLLQSGKDVVEAVSSALSSANFISHCESQNISISHVQEFYTYLTQCRT